jgi:hypothetical protein
MRLSLSKSTAFFLIAVSAHQLAAKDKHKPAEPKPQDQISVDAHLADSGGPILRFVATQHYDRAYVYAERGPGQPVTLIDVTKADQPTVISQLDAGANLVAVAGTAALSSTSVADATTAPAQTIRVMDFSDPANPKVTRQFEGVTAVQKIGSVILLANADGVWVLSQHLANDPSEDERYARKVLYGDSMFK